MTPFWILTMCIAGSGGIYCKPVGIYDQWGSCVNRLAEAKSFPIVSPKSDNNAHVVTMFCSQEKK